MNSILISIKQLLGITEDYRAFDAELILHINSVFRILNQLGVGVVGFEIFDESATWQDFLGDKMSMLSHVKTFVYLKVKYVWDPPTVGAQMNAIDQTLKELEWRINVQADPDDYEWTTNVDDEIEDEEDEEED